MYTITYTGTGPEPLLATSPELYTNFYPGSISLIGEVATVRSICPPGKYATACIGGTVPPGIGSLQLSGGLSTELGPVLLGSGSTGLNQGFNKYNSCGATVRFNYPIPSQYLRQSNLVFVKVEAYCKNIQESVPTPPYTPPYTPPVYDPCDCSQQVAPLGCISNQGCATGTLCYVDARCPGFQASQNSQRIGQFFKCVEPYECR